MLDIQQDEYLPVWGETGKKSISVVCLKGKRISFTGNTFLIYYLTLSLSLSPYPDETSFEAGIKVQIHSQEEPPFIDQLGFGVSPGFQTFVSCQEQRVHILECGA